MRASLRITLLMIVAVALTAIFAGPVFAQTTCACDNGQSVTSTSSAPDACDSDCQLVGANGGVPAAAGDYDANDDDENGDGDTEVIVPPRRIAEPGELRRR